MDKILTGQVSPLWSLGLSGLLSMAVWRNCSTYPKARVYIALCKASWYDEVIGNQSQYP